MMTLPDFRYRQLIVHVAGGSGEILRFRNDNIVLESRGGEILAQHSCHRTFALFIIGNISITSQLLRHCSEFEFPVVLLGNTLRPIASIRCIGNGNTNLRKMQYCCPLERQLDISKMLIGQKISNQLKLLKALPCESTDSIRLLLTIDVNNASSTKELMGMEGTASRIFFSTYFKNFNWLGREPRKKADIFNLLLDIGYSSLFHFISALLSLYGFDLFCGVHHGFFHQRMSLVCDLMEPFRCIIDKQLRKSHNLGQIHKSDFFCADGHWNIEKNQISKYLKLFLNAIISEKEAMFTYCQSYYRWFGNGKRLEDFPVYQIA